jgi:hypothetical protein
MGLSSSNTGPGIGGVTYLGLLHRLQGCRKSCCKGAKTRRSVITTCDIMELTVSMSAMLRVWCCTSLKPPALDQPRPAHNRGRNAFDVSRFDPRLLSSVIGSMLNSSRCYQMKLLFFAFCSKILRGRKYQAQRLHAGIRLAGKLCSKLVSVTIFIVLSVTTSFLSFSNFCHTRHMGCVLHSVPSSTLSFMRSQRTRTRALTYLPPRSSRRSSLGASNFGTLSRIPD